MLSAKEPPARLHVCAELAIDAGDKALSVVNGIRDALPGELAKHAISEAVKAASKPGQREFPLVPANFGLVVRRNVTSKGHLGEPLVS